MPETKLSKLEFRVMDALWDQGPLSIREIQETFSEKKLPAYTTIQTTVNRMELKGVVRRTRKVGNFFIFEALITRESAQRKLIDELLGFFGGSGGPVMAHLIEAGKLSLKDVQDAEQLLQKRRKK